VALKDLEAALDHKAKAQYGKLDDDQCLELLLERKWYRTLLKGIFELYTKVNHEIADRVSELAVRYENTLPELENEVAEQESKARAHLEKMGYRW
jgi:type I restriction enzyme M protein